MTIANKKNIQTTPSSPQSTNKKCFKSATLFRRIRRIVFPPSAGSDEVVEVDEEAEPFSDPEESEEEVEVTEESVEIEDEGVEAEPALPAHTEAPTAPIIRTRYVTADAVDDQRDGRDYSRSDRAG